MARLRREVFFLVDLHCRDAGSARQRVAAERAADRALRSSVHDFSTAGDCGNRHAARQRLCGGDDIRGCARFCPVLGSEILAGTAIAALHFIGDEQDAVVIADLAHSLDPLDRCGDEAAFTLERFDEHAGDFVGWDALVEGLLQALDVVVDGLFLGVALRRTVEVGVRRTGDFRRERAHAAGVRLLSGECHREVRAAVECAGEADHTLTAGVGLGDLDGVLVALSTGVRKIGLLVLAATRNRFVESFGEGDVAFVSDDIEDGVEVLGGLVLNCLDKLGAGVTDVEHADAADPVEELIAIEVFEHRTLAALDAQRIGVAAQTIGNGLVTALEELLGLRARHAFGDDLRQLFCQCHSGTPLLFAIPQSVGNSPANFVVILVTCLVLLAACCIRPATSKLLRCVCETLNANTKHLCSRRTSHSGREFSENPQNSLLFHRYFSNP